MMTEFELIFFFMEIDPILCFCPVQLDHLCDVLGDEHYTLNMCIQVKTQEKFPSELSLQVVCFGKKRLDRCVHVFPKCLYKKELME